MDVGAFEGETDGSGVGLVGDLEGEEVRGAPVGKPSPPLALVTVGVDVGLDDGALDGLDDGLDVGEDSGAPVSPDYGPVGNHFNGDIKGVQLSVEDDPNNGDRLVKPNEAIRAMYGRQ